MQQDRKAMSFSNILQDVDEFFEEHVERGWSAWLGALFLIVGLVCCVMIAQELWTKHQLGQGMQRLFGHHRQDSALFPAALFALFFAIVLLKNRRWPATAALLLFCFAGYSTLTLGTGGLLCAAVLGASLIAIYRRPSARGSLTLLASAIAFAGALVGGLEFATPAPLARAKSDMRIMAMAIEAYEVDHAAYPPWTRAPAQKAYWDSNSPMPTFRAMPGTLAPFLTTPISYITSVPMDNLRRHGERRTFAYWALDGAGFVLISAGPNGKFDIDPRRLMAIQTAEELKQFETLFVNPCYDPTNGLYNSAGDIWRIEHK